MTKQTDALKMAIETLEYLIRKGEPELVRTLLVCKEALAEQPTQEPMTHVIGIDNDGKEVVAKLQSPLYTHPKQWQGLSDYEIFKIEGLDCVDEEYIKRFARAIEAKLKELNT